MCNPTESFIPQPASTGRGAAAGLYAALSPRTLAEAAMPFHETTVVHTEDEGN